MEMKDYIVKDLGTKRVGKRTQRFALIKCPKCGKIEERRVRNDVSAQCRLCGMKTMSSHRKAEMHGDTVKGSEHNRLYQIWRGMNRRCHDPKSNGYNQYGQQGVTVCEEWRKSYVAFKTWALVNGYQQHLTLDKDELCEAQNIIPKVYSPTTCKWKTLEENASNNLKITEDNAKLIAKLLESYEATPEELAKEYGVKKQTILTRSRPYRIKKYVAKK